MTARRSTQKMHTTTSRGKRRSKRRAAGAWRNHTGTGSNKQNEKLASCRALPHQALRFFPRKTSVSRVLDCSATRRISKPYAKKIRNRLNAHAEKHDLFCVVKFVYIDTSLLPRRSPAARSSPGACGVPMSVMPKVLMSRVMLEMVDVGATFRSSITVYVTTPCTNPAVAASSSQDPVVGPTICTGTVILPPQYRCWHG